MASPLEGRRLWIAGIGGAGMSAYATLARAWGADVRGWDRVRTPYLDHLEGVDVEISDEPPAAPDGWEAFVSTAFTGRVPGKSRAELLAELVSLRDAGVIESISPTPSERITAISPTITGETDLLSANPVLARTLRVLADAVRPGVAGHPGPGQRARTRPGALHRHRRGRRLG